MEIKFNNVYFSYNKNTPIENEVLKNINLDIKEGKIDQKRAEKMILLYLIFKNVKSFV